MYLSGNVPDEHLLEIPDRPAASVLLSLSSDNNSFLFLGIYSLKFFYCIFTLFCTINCISFNIDNFNRYFILNRSVGLRVRRHNIQHICYTNLCHISICHSCDRPVCCQRTTLNAIRKRYKLLELRRLVSMTLKNG